MDLRLRSNLAAPDVDLPSIGTFVPGAGDELQILDPEEQQEVLADEEIRALADDNAYPGPPDPSNHTLIYVVDGVDTPVSGLDALSGLAPFVPATPGDDGIQGLVPAPPAGTPSSYYLAADATWKPLPSTFQLPNLEQGFPPSTLQLPDGFWLFWYDTSNLALFMVRNRGGVLFQVELTIQP